jgi:hypothetical protein
VYARVVVWRRVSRALVKIALRFDALRRQLKIILGDEIESPKKHMTKRTLSVVILPPSLDTIQNRWRGATPSPRREG